MFQALAVGVMGWRWVCFFDDDSNRRWSLCGYQSMLQVVVVLSQELL